MEILITSLVILILILFLLASGTWVFASLMTASTLGLFLMSDFSFHRIGLIMGKIVYRSASGWELAAIPMFVLIGEILFRTDLSDRMFRGLVPLVDWLPGRLLHTNIVGCTIVAALNGTSTATTAIVGKITLPELEKRNYDKSLAIGSLAGAGGFGMLIPPSVPLIIYGVLSETSIAKLFAAGIFPGLLLSGLFVGYLVIRSLLDKNLAPGTRGQYTARDYGHCFLLIVPILILIVTILGSIYTGLATPTEAAAVGVLVAVIMTLLLHQLTWSIIKESLLGAVKISCMVCSIMMTASFLATAMGFLHVPQDISQFITSLNLSEYWLIFFVGLFYILLGLFLDGISITVMSLPITLPLVIGAGFDPIWFGIFLVIMIELGLITPPVGFNLFVVQGISKYPIEKTARAAAPFFGLMVLGVLILVIWPSIVTWLPSCM